jgi:hypothetical protein
MRTCVALTGYSASLGSYPCSRSAQWLGVITRPEVIQTDVAVVALTAVQELSRGCSARADRNPKRVEVIRVRDAWNRVRKEPDVSVSIVAIEAGRPIAADLLILADALQTVSIGSGHGTVRQLIEDLRAARSDCGRPQGTWS